MPSYLYIAIALAIVFMLYFYYKVCRIAFKHHLVTGFISLIPFVNLFIVHVIWEKARVYVSNVLILLLFISILWTLYGNVALPWHWTFEHQVTVENNNIDIDLDKGDYKSFAIQPNGTGAVEAPKVEEESTILKPLYKIDLEDK